MWPICGFGHITEEILNGKTLVLVQCIMQSVIQWFEFQLFIRPGYSNWFGFSEIISQFNDTDSNGEH